jgi:hypothetical protein
MAATTDAEALDAALARLRATPLDGFLEARKALAAELKAAGRKDDAKVVAAVRKPTASAWAVDQLHHLRPDELGELLALGEELRTGQRRALSTGQGGAALRETAARRRALVRALTDAAAGALGDGGRAVSPSTRDEISATLDAATVDPDVAAALAEGSLEKAAVAPAGFGPLEHLSLVPDRPAPERRPERARPERAAPSEADEEEPADDEDDEDDDAGGEVVELPVAAAPKGPTAAERARLESAEAAVAAAEDGVRQARDEADSSVVAAQDARRAAQEAAAEADRLEAQARAARRAAGSADAAAARAAKAVDRAREAVDKAERKLDTAQARLDALLD